MLKKNDLDEDTHNALKKHFLYMDQCVLCEEGTEATFKFLNKGHYEDVKAFNIENVDMSNVKNIIDTIETK